MVLEYRNKDNNLFGKVKGKLGLHQYGLLIHSSFFKKETKTFVGKGSFVCFVCVEYCKINMTDEFEVWFEPNDYIKIIP
jgi:hypothetical protein